MACVCVGCHNLIGFHVMQEHESPRSAFELIFSRWITAPKLIIYDNTCNLDIFCRTREPAYFKDTLIVVDRLHYKSHHGCSPIYDMDLYQSLRGVNSQAVEQLWSQLRFNTTRMGYMSQVNFFL